MNILKALLFMCLAPGMIRGLAAGSSPIVCPPYYMIHYAGSTNEGELKIGVSYVMWLPAGVKTLRGIVVHQHGCGPGDDREGRAQAGDLHWQALARKHECALLAPSYEQSDKEHCRWWLDPRNGSDRRFIQALADLAVQSQHPELTTVPWALWGHSGGAAWAGSMLLIYPERIAAVWLRSGVPLQMAEPFPSAALNVPVMCNLGTQEGVSVTTNGFAIAWPLVRQFFQEFHGRSGLIGVAVDPNSGHDCGNTRYLAIPWFDACLKARLPTKAGSAGLQPMLTGGAWLAPLLGNKAQPATQFTGDLKTSVWLPDERIAKAWGEYARDGNVSDPSPPPPPQNVRVSTVGELTWEAEADLESGIAEFIIERDGKKLARVPEQHTGYFVGRATFQQIGYGDYPTPPLAEMRYTDATAKGSGKHTYAVRTVNTVGSKSEPATAVEMPGSGTAQHGRVMPPEFMSRQWPQGPETITPRVAIKLDTTLLDACVGHFEIAPSAVFPTGGTLKIWREADRLLVQPRSGNQTPGVLDIYPVSETNFFIKVDDSQLTFIKNGNGEVTGVIHRSSRGGIPDQLARKVPDPAK